MSSSLARIPAKLGRHADHFQKGPECADAVAGSDVGMLVVHVTAPDAHGNLGKAVDVVIHDVFHPCREDDGQRRAVRCVIAGGELVRQCMGRPVLFAPDAANVVVGHGSCQHEVGAAVVVFGIFQGKGQFVLDGQQDGFTQPVGQFDAFGIGEVAFQHVRHDVGCTTSRRQWRQGKGEFRVQDGQHRSDPVAGSRGA